MLKLRQIWLLSLVFYFSCSEEPNTSSAKSRGNGLVGAWTLRGFEASKDSHISERSLEILGNVERNATWIFDETGKHGKKYPTEKTPSSGTYTYKPETRQLTISKTVSGELREIRYLLQEVGTERLVLLELNLNLKMIFQRQ